jgi:hypothetical protein
MAVGLLLASPSGAQTQCAVRQELLKGLADQYAENPVAIGLGSDGNVVELLTSEKGSWSLLVTTPSGIACLVGSGEAWQALPRQPSGRDS